MYDKPFVFQLICVYSRSSERTIERIYKCDSYGIALFLQGEKKTTRSNVCCLIASISTDTILKQETPYKPIPILTQYTQMFV